MDARGAQTVFLYDGLHRITSKSYSFTEATPNVSYSYWTTPVSGCKNIGQLKQVTASDTWNRNDCYDDFGRVTTSRHKLEFEGR